MDYRTRCLPSPIQGPPIRMCPCVQNGFLDKNRASFKKACVPSHTIISLRTELNRFFWEIGDDRRIQTEQVALVSGILIQHAVGGALCLPSVLGLGGYLPAGLAAALARHG